MNLIVQSVLDSRGMYCNEILFTHQRLMLFGNIKEQYTCAADRYASSDTWFRLAWSASLTNPQL